jgi:hypothetical protein
VDIFEGIPFRIDFNTGENLFDGYLNLPEGEFLCNKVVANAVESTSIDWLNEVADSFTFEYLAAPVAEGGAGTIANSDYVIIPYQINNQSTKLDTAILISSGISIVSDIVMMTDTIISNVEEIKADPLKWSNIITIVFLVIRLILLIASMVVFFDNLFKYALQSIKYKAGMYIHDLCEKGAAHLGYRFESTILNGDYARYGGIGFDNVALIPESYNQFEDDEGILGVFEFREKEELNGYYRGTFGDLLRELKVMFNAKVIISEENGEKVLRLERVDYSLSGDTYQIPNVDKSESPYKYNTDELKAYYNLSFTPDLNDKNVWQDYRGTELQVITSQKYSIGRGLIKGENVKRIGFSLSAVKLDLTKSESFVRGFIGNYFAIVNIAFNFIRRLIGLVNSLIFILNKVINKLKKLKLLKKSTKPIRGVDDSYIPNPFKKFMDKYRERRTEILIMENDFINTSKVIALNKNWKEKDPSKPRKVSRDNRNLLDANHLWSHFHSINSFVGDNNNQYIEYSLSGIPFCIDDYNLVKNNSAIKDSDGVTEGEVISLKWNVYGQTADIRYKVKKTYTNNLKETKIFSDGR